MAPLDPIATTPNDHADSKAPPADAARTVPHTHDLRRVEEALHASEARLRLMTTQVPAVLWSTDTDLRMIWADGTGLASQNLQARQVIGISTADFFQIDDPHSPAIAAQRQALLGEPATYPIEWAEHIYQCHVEPFRDTEGQIVGTIGIALDVTEHKRLEARLLQAQKMESVGRLAGGLAHDFNNLLTAIVGYAELGMQELPPDSLIRTDMDEILKAARRASALTRQLLAFARKPAVAPRVLNLNDLLLEMDRLLRRLIGADIELVVLPSLDAVSVRVDPGQIEQVLVNLVINAHDAMPDGGTLTIAIGAVAVDHADVQALGNMGAGDYVCLTVSDTGSGMSPEVQTHLFEPFFTTKDQGKGTGLGLATCYGIIKQHGGAIRVDSAVGLGTTISIYLPRVTEPAPAAYDAAGWLPRGTETILLVEDEPAVRVLAARVLRELGYHVLEAGHGAEALQVIQGYGLANIELLLTDVVMPQLGGVALAEQLVDLRPGIKVLLMSGYTDNVIIQHDRPTAGGAFLQKPFAPAVLARKVREVLDAR